MPQLDISQKYHEEQSFEKTSLALQSEILS